MANMMFIESPVSCKLINMALVSGVDIETSIEDPESFEVIATTNIECRYILYTGSLRQCEEFMERLKGALSSIGAYLLI